MSASPATRKDRLRREVELAPGGRRLWVWVFIKCAVMLGAGAVLSFISH